jgi:hypothetical protein
MYGLGIAKLNVIAQIQTESNQIIEESKWSRNRDQGDQWFIAKVPMDYSKDFRVIFEGTVGVRTKSDIVVFEILSHN